MSKYGKTQYIYIGMLYFDLLNFNTNEQKG